MARAREEEAGVVGEGGGQCYRPGRASEAILKDQAFMPNTTKAAGIESLGVQRHFTQPDSRTGKAVLKT